MDSEISGTVLSATPRVTSNGKTVYDIAFSDGNTYATFDAKIWAKVQAVGQQPASARVSVKQKGNFTNFYLNDIAPAGQLPPPGVTLHAPAPQTASGIPLAPAISPPSRGGGMTPEREQKIVKQSSFATAFNFVGLLYQGSGDSELEQAKAQAFDLALEFYQRVMGIQPAAELVAAGVAGAPPEVVGDAIPWQ